MSALKPLAWSFSSVNDFLNCPRSYYLKRVSKETPVVETEAMRFGTIQHKHLEDRVRKNTPLPPDLSWLDPMLTKFANIPDGEIFAEHQVALTKGLKYCGWFDKTVWVRGILDVGYRTETEACVLDYKGLALDTPIPTPLGWSTMGALEIGDTVFGGDGVPCTVTAKSAIHNRQCYKLEFDDKASVVCDDEHLWVTNGEVKTAKTIAETLVYRTQKHHKITLHPGLDLPHADLPLHPYVLGVWLGDGKHSSGEVCKPDVELWHNIERTGFTLSHDYNAGTTKATSRTVYGLRTKLRESGLLRNKHIPDIYLRASFAQRLALLQGLMDTDGSANATRKQAVFMTCDKNLSDSVMELLHSLGQRPSQATTKQKGFGLVVDAWPISFRPQGIKAFTLTRKQAIADSFGRGNSWRRLVVDAKEVASVPTQCITVNSSDNTYLCGKEMIVTHNTGKRKFDKDQLMLFAGLEFATRPLLEKVKTGYVWLKDKKLDTEVYTRADVPMIWGHFIPTVEKIEKAMMTGEWVAKPSGLCPWCAAKPSQCKFSKN